MVSDVLSDAVSEMDAYLEGDVPGEHTGAFRDRIVAVRNVMDALRADLDILPVELGGSQTYIDAARDAYHQAVRELQAELRHARGDA